MVTFKFSLEGQKKSSVGGKEEWFLNYFALLKLFMYLNSLYIHIAQKQYEKHIKKSQFHSISIHPFSCSSYPAPVSYHFYWFLILF